MLVIATTSFATARKTEQLYRQLADVSAAFDRQQRSLEDIRSGVQLSSILVRDYLLEPSLIQGDYYRHQILESRTAMSTELERLRTLMGPEHQSKIDMLREQLDGYWASLDPMFDWTPAQKKAIAFWFLRKTILPHRDAALNLADDIEKLNASNLREQQADTAASERNFRYYIRRIGIVTAFLTLLVGCAATWRVYLLEIRSAESQRRTEEAEQELRRLSHQLVRAQEDERRSISRELHDQVGQMLTGLRMQIRSLARLHSATREQFAAAVEEARAVLDGTVQAVRDLAMGLRPSMLDDLGLAAALEWQARDFARRFDIPVTLDIRDDIGGLPEGHRIHIYRIVQEALTNVARHSKATTVEISITASGSSLQLRIRDNGVGLSTARRHGLGLRGMEERAHQIGGDLIVRRSPAGGTELVVNAPLVSEAAHV